MVNTHVQFGGQASNQCRPSIVLLTVQQERLELAISVICQDLSSKHAAVCVAQREQRYCCNIAFNDDHPTFSS